MNCINCDVHQTARIGREKKQKKESGKEKKMKKEGKEGENETSCRKQTEILEVKGAENERKNTSERVGRGERGRREESEKKNNKTFSFIQ